MTTTAPRATHVPRLPRTASTGSCSSRRGPNAVPTTRDKQVIARCDTRTTSSCGPGTGNAIARRGDDEATTHRRLQQNNEASRQRPVGTSKNETWTTCQQEARNVCQNVFVIFHSFIHINIGARTSHTQTRANTLQSRFSNERTQAQTTDKTHEPANEPELLSLTSISR
jgi:hypothetical protein